MDKLLISVAVLKAKHIFICGGYFITGKNNSGAASENDKEDDGIDIAHYVYV